MGPYGSRKKCKVQSYQIPVISSIYLSTLASWWWWVDTSFRPGHDLAFPTLNTGTGSQQIRGWGEVGLGTIWSGRENIIRGKIRLLFFAMITSWASRMSRESLPSIIFVSVVAPYLLLFQYQQLTLNFRAEDFFRAFIRFLHIKMTAIKICCWCRHWHMALKNGPAPHSAHVQRSNYYGIAWLQMIGIAVSSISSLVNS